jgi:hypothetical protein
VEHAFPWWWRARRALLVLLCWAPAAAAAEEGGPVVTVTPRGALVVNLGYNTGTLIPGAYAFFATPPALSHNQFFLSPANTVLGFKVDRPPSGDITVTAALDLSLRSTTLQTSNILDAQFYDAYVQIAAGRWRRAIGQYPDVVIPVAPESFNSFPIGYLPGSLGFARPQIRGELRIPVGGEYQFLVAASANTPIQTFDLSDELVGRQAGLPDGQGRLSFGYGTSARPWERPFEVGVNGHVGRRRVSTLDASLERLYTTWSAGVDLRLTLPWGMLIKGRLWKGQLLGDYAAGALQTVSPVSLRAVRAKGGWVAVQQRLTAQWRAAAGYGRDDPNGADLDPGGRTLNEEAFAQVLWELTRQIGGGVEVSRWRTVYIDRGATSLWRLETLSFVRF